MSKIRNEYALLQKGNNQLKIQLQKYQNYVENVPQNSHTKYQKPIRKRKTLLLWWSRRKWREWLLCYRNSKNMSKQTKKNDNLWRWNRQSSWIWTTFADWNEEQEEEQDKIQAKSKKRPPKQMEKSKQLRKGITKFIKM